MTLTSGLRSFLRIAPRVEGPRRFVHTRTAGPGPSRSSSIASNPAVLGWPPAAAPAFLRIVPDSFDSLGPPAPTVAVVVLTHDRVHLLRECVENVLMRASPLTSEIVI